MQRVQADLQTDLIVLLLDAFRFKADITCLGVERVRRDLLQMQHLLMVAGDFGKVTSNAFSFLISCAGENLLFLFFWATG